MLSFLRSSSLSVSRAEDPPHGELKYRADIDGLRAIAVLAVIAFHAFPEVFRGGFIGVDIFFVISGYLISSVIFSNLITGNFSFIEFYKRRIKRIFPALILVLIVCYLFGWFALLPDEYMQLSKHIVATTGSAQNFALFFESGYFDNASETKPLLHAWSLGVEEQFYVFFPMLCWLCRRNRLRLGGGILIFSILSFFLNIKQVRHNPIAAFYLPSTRCWEILAGALLAFTQHFLPKNEPTTAGSMIYRNIEKNNSHAVAFKVTCGASASILSTTGLALLLAGFYVINEQSRFPGAIALLPILGSLFIIQAGQTGWFNRIILSHPIAVWLGLIS